MKITLNREFNESEYAVKVFKASRAMQIEAVSILTAATRRIEELSCLVMDDTSYIDTDRAIRLSIGFHNYLMAALRKLEPRPIVLRQVKHYLVGEDWDGIIFLLPAHGAKRRFLTIDILCGDPIGAPSGAQLPTEGESEIEQARR